MNKLCVLACLLVSVAATAQTSPKVVFVVDQALSSWLTSPSFAANPNWIAAPVWREYSGVGYFQTNVINQHPTYVFVDIATYAMLQPGYTHGLSNDWSDVVSALQPLVQMARAANIKVILGNAVIEHANRVPMPNQPYFVGTVSGDVINTWLQSYGTANNIPVVNFEYWLANGCYGVVATPFSGDCTLANPVEDDTGVPDLLTPTALGYQFMTQMTQTAIATYGLTMRGGYLSNVMTVSGYDPDGIGSGPPAAQVNKIQAGANVQFTPQATWSDGVTRPMLNVPYGGALGTWWSTNANVMSVNQQGLAYAYSPLLTYPAQGTSTAQVWFKSATGQTFSPWGMTVYQPEF
jgi:hypothetical protein